MRYEAAKLKLSDDFELDSLLSLPSDVQERLLVTKFEHWKYEEELRAFVDLSTGTKDASLYFYPFDATLQLREVILGPLFPKKRVDVIRAEIHGRYPSVVVSRARLGFKYFEVKEDGRYPPA